MHVPGPFDSFQALELHGCVPTTEPSGLWWRSGGAASLAQQTCSIASFDKTR